MTVLVSSSPEIRAVFEFDSHFSLLCLLCCSSRVVIANRHLHGLWKLFCGKLTRMNVLRAYVRMNLLVSSSPEFDSHFLLLCCYSRV